MLVLTRNVLTSQTPKQTVVFRDRATGRILATVGLTKVIGKRGRLAIQASNEIEIIRGELIDDPDSLMQFSGSAEAQEKA